MGVIVGAGLATLLFIAGESRRPFVTALSAAAMIAIAASVTAGAMSLAERTNLVRSHGTWSHAIWYLLVALASFPLAFAAEFLIVAAITGDTL